jgi:hypothetical protein
MSITNPTRYLAVPSPSRRSHSLATVELRRWRRLVRVAVHRRTIVSVANDRVIHRHLFANESSKILLIDGSYERSAAVSDFVAHEPVQMCFI